MKLSENGLKKIKRWQDASRLGHAYPIDEINFSTDDFEGGHFHFGNNHIALTVEEAGILVRCAANEFCRLILEHAPVDLARQVEVLMYDLVKRIEKAEKCNER